MTLLCFVSNTMQYAITTRRIGHSVTNYGTRISNCAIRTHLFSTTSTSSGTNTTISNQQNKTKKFTPKLQKSQEPLYLREGLFSVIKPNNWTSSNAVEYIRRIFEVDARKRGVQGKNRKLIKVGKIPPLLKVGHGGTLDPLATGVLVVGVGRGTKELKYYLKGTKKYVIRVKLGIETTTLDMEGNITKIVPYSHITEDMIEYVLPSFVGDIEQVPPLYSAIKQNGKKLYEIARDKDSNPVDVVIPSRNVTIDSIRLTSFEKGSESLEELNTVGETHLYPQRNPTIFELEVECGGGTYMRSLARDIALKLGTVATCTSIERVKQGPFLKEDSLVKENGWDVEAFIKAIDTCKEKYCL